MIANVELQRADVAKADCVRLSIQIKGNGNYSANINGRQVKVNETPDGLFVAEGVSAGHCVCHACLVFYSDHIAHKKYSSYNIQKVKRNGFIQQRH
jgi:hypothetical protein